MKSSPLEQVLLYDGLCGFCEGTVQFILARDRMGTLKFAPLQGRFAANLLREHPELAGIDSLMLVRTGGSHSETTVLLRSAAAVAIGQYLGGIWRVLSAFVRVLPVSVRDAAYDAFARRRIRWFGQRDVCRIPTGVERGRFLE
jgi:predicted DCC family thiol-disulfide oxidoreductase YuxK